MGELDLQRDGDQGRHKACPYRAGAVDGGVGFAGGMAGWAISRSCSGFWKRSCSGGGPLVQDFLGFESGVDKGIGIVALLCQAVMRRDEDVDGKDELFAYRPANGVAPFGPVAEGFEDDEEIDVAVGAGVGAGVAAEEDDLLRVEFLGDQLSNGLNCRPVDRDFSHLRETSLRMFYDDLD